MSPLEVHMKQRFRRSALYVPGDSEAMLLRAAGFNADVLVLNLEDGVARTKKEGARANVAAALQTHNFGGRETAVRVNDVDAALGRDDLAKIIPRSPDGIVLPKVEKASVIETAAGLIGELERKYGMPEGAVCIHAMIESAAGVLHAPAIAAASARMASLIFGSADFAADMQCRPGPDRAELLLALQWIVTSARASGIDAIDAPCFDIRNDVLLREEAGQARRLGFSGKSALHPGQLGTINSIFDVTEQEIAWAERVISELDQAEGRGKALTTVDGQLLDNPHRAAAERILSRKRG
jgi:citrate lyase subunit beta/citryl-CoA lyase